jgi:hypothetical protein
MPSMQHTGVPYPAGKFTFGVAAALTRLYAAFDRETCPHFDCGFDDGSGSTGGGGGQKKMALYIRNESGRGPHVYGTTSQRILVEPGRTYQIMLLAAAKGLRSNGGASITVDPQWRIRPIRLDGGTRQWTKYSGTFTADSSYIDLRIISEDAGEVWISDLKMHQLN